MTVYAKHVSTKQTPQTEPITGKAMVANSAGGFSFAVDNWTRLDRFLVLGADGGTYYIGEKKLTVENAQCVQDCLKEDYLRTINRIAEISHAGRAPKNDPAIFALALAASHPDMKTRQEALFKLPVVCRTGTHLFQFVENVNELRGWGKALRRAVADWYMKKQPKDLAYQMLKYQQRNGWSHRDLLRLSHPKPNMVQREFDNRLQTDTHAVLFHWAVKGWDSVGEQEHPDEALRQIWAFERLKRFPTEGLAVKFITDYRMTREMIPTQLLTSPAVWEAMLEHMPMTAMLRNLATMTRIGLLTPLSKAVAKVLNELSNVERLRKSRIHPIAVLSALKTYAQGRGERGQNTWNPVSQVIDALDGAFYQSFGNITPTGKRWYLGIDVSGSMYGSTIAGVTGLTAGLGAGAMALITANVEASWYMACFNTQMVPFAPSPRQRLDDFCGGMSGLPWGRTDCAQPMLDAIAKKLPVDVFVVYTDNETYAGSIHPTQALTQYRQKMGIPAKLIVVGMTSNGFTIADGTDAGQLDVVGFDSSVPQVMSDFAVA